MDGGCCSPANRVQWVAIYNIVSAKYYKESTAFIAQC